MIADGDAGIRRSGVVSARAVALAALAVIVFAVVWLAMHIAATATP